ncbi:uncharacterized protein BP5553_02822 [Venustampulla echinocandica]|uniref:Heterokaryon incompatibility domain-containing protein n=1 Tax=Venustampulla echinocandica TaxID=2656787 RepID=A0A370TSH4_9HELO|nr:uncharacterized protein BP5553_02822 [Venustampulla echinocandica]RDL38482.1 hypothetical protein BP5553_02822 [Venustampulla echinocandica]
MSGSQGKGKGGDGYKCSECSRIPWGSEEYMYSYPYKSTWTSNPGACRFNDPNCSTCNFIFDCRRAHHAAQIPDDSDEEPLRYDMITLDFVNYGHQMRIVNKQPRSRYKFVEAGVSTETRAYTHSTLIPRRVIQPDKIDYALLQAWTAYCDEKHGALCGEKSELPLDILHVIDCETSLVVQLPTLDDDYITLSYVWGQGGDPDIVPDLTLPGVPPRVISDAMVVVQKMGYRYLWVDRYCIPQSSAAFSIKDKLIGCMDLIYSNAKLTIVDAASDGPECGLLGVTTGERIIPPMTTVGRCTLTYTVPTGNIVRNCKWFTRGWTFQEGLLSPRLLLFTKAGVLFRCGKMDGMETLDSIPLVPVDNNKWLRDMKISGSPETFFSHLIDYMKRDLSHQSDAYNAIRGILQAFKRMGTPTFGCLPLRVMGQRGKIEDLSSHMLLATSLSWSIENDASYRWTRALERRPGFPSWTWLGWMKAPSSTAWDYSSATEISSSKLCKLPLKENPKAHISSIDVEYQSGRTVRLSQAVESICCESEAGLAIGLHMDCWVFQVVATTGKWFPRPLDDCECHLELPPEWSILHIGNTQRVGSEQDTSLFRVRETFTFQVAEPEVVKLFKKKDSYVFTCLLLASTDGWIGPIGFKGSTGLAALLLRPHPEKAAVFERFDVFYAYGADRFVQIDDKNATMGDLALRRERICLV